MSEPPDEPTLGHGPSANTSGGHVSLVGAGPGHPELISVLGKRRLQQADVVFYDGLVHEDLVAGLSARTEKTSRSRASDPRIVSQAELSKRLIEEARAGRRVVRLKGGDPFIFGRGAEEADALCDAGIPFDIVPGITAATAAADYCGIPLTHRRHSSAVALITGHEDPARPESRLRYDILAEFPGTLVFYMPLGRLKAIADELQGHRMPADTPAAVVCRAGTPRQYVVRCTLGTLADAGRRDRVRPPALVIIGEATESTHRQWYERGPLFGRRIAVTRPEQHYEETAGAIRELSGEPVRCPLLATEPLQGADRHQARQSLLQQTERSDWLVFTSVNGVRHYLQLLQETTADLRLLGPLRVAAIGGATAGELQRAGLKPDLTAERRSSEGLADALGPDAAGARILIACADRTRGVLPGLLERAGAQVSSLTVYHHRIAERIPERAAELLRDGELEWLPLSSPAMVTVVSQTLKEIPSDRRPRIAALSPITAEALTQAGLSVALQPPQADWASLIESIAAFETTN